MLADDANLMMKYKESM